MFLNQLSLQPDVPGRLGLWKALADPYRAHQEIWSLFSSSPDQARDFLYRLDFRGNRPQALVLAPRQPNPSPLWRSQSKPFSPQLENGDVLRFSLRANPVVTRDGKRHDVVMDAKKQMGWKDMDRMARPSEARVAQDACVPWLERRAGKHGFELLSGSVCVEAYTLYDFRKGSGRRIRLAGCDLMGLLRVTDRDPFERILRTGIGSAKGFGFGLMLVARAG